MFLQAVQIEPSQIFLADVITSQIPTSSGKELKRPLSIKIYFQNCSKFYRTNNDAIRYMKDINKVSLVSMYLCVAVTS